MNNSAAVLLASVGAVIASVALDSGGLLFLGVVGLVIWLNMED